MLISKKRYIINTQFNHYASCIIWFLVPLSTQFLIKIPIYSRHIVLKLVDQSWLETTGGQGLNKYIINKSLEVSFLRPDSPNSYLLGSILCILLIAPIIFILFVCSVINTLVFHTKNTVIVIHIR
jgi:hypothetical protein